MFEKIINNKSKFTSISFSEVIYISNPLYLTQNWIKLNLYSREEEDCGRMENIFKTYDIGIRLFNS